MVRDRIRDGERIAQLLASELTGLETGPLATVAVVDAVDDVTPAPEGARAYDVERGGEALASVAITEHTARIEFQESVDLDVPTETTDLRVDRGEPGPVLVVESGAAVKPAVDVLVAAMDA